MTEMPSPRFIRGLHAYLDHWLAQTAVMNDTTIHRLNPDFPGLRRLVELGLVLPQTQEKTAVLMLQCFFWVEQVGYVPVWQPLVALAVQRLLAAPPRLRFRLLKQLGQLQRLQHQLETAVDTFQKAETLARTLEDEPAIAEIHMNLCQTYHLQTDYQEAERHGRLALDQLADHQTSLKAITLRTLGIMAQEQGHLTQAETYLQKALNFSVSAKERALTLNVLAVIRQQQNQAERALQTYAEALALLDSTANTNLFVEIQLNRGGLHFSLDQLDAAEAAFRETERLLKQRPGLLFHKGRSANNLGCVLRQRAQFDAAETYFRRSIRQFSQSGSDIYQANAWGNLAKLYACQDRLDEARQCYDKALRLVTPYPDNVLAQELHTTYTRLRAEC